MTDVRKILLDSMMASLPPSSGPSPNQDMVTRLGEQVNAAIVDEFLRVLDAANLKVVPKFDDQTLASLSPRQRQLLGELLDCPGEGCTVRCNNRDHWVLRA